jgi:nucleoside phosphorylase
MTAPKVDIGILTIRDDEFRAVLNAFPEEVGDGVFGGRREYTLRYANGGPGVRYTLALLRQTEQGNGEAQDAARDLLDDLDPSLFLVVGIAGGVASDDATLGDVVLSTRIYDFTVESRRFGEDPTYSLAGGPVEKGLAAKIANLAGRERDLGDWGSGLPPRPNVSWDRRGQLYGPKEWQEDLRNRLESHFGPNAEARGPEFFTGPIASSDRLIKDPTVLIPILSSARHIVAVEMESSGVYRASRGRCPMLAVRGISDLVGLKRNENWTKYACASAAAFTRAFLKTQPVVPKSSPPTADGKQESASTSPDVLFANLAPIESFPERFFISTAEVSTYKQAWKRLREGVSGILPAAWLLHEKRLYSFDDPSTSVLQRITSGDDTETHRTKEWAESEDPDKRRLFAQLMKMALKDDLSAMGVRYLLEDDLFYFAGWPEDEPRVFNYKNVRVRSTMTVVSHYDATTRDGQKFKYLRHLAFVGRFRYLSQSWFLEITPTYLFTTDGKTKYRYHDAQLSGIKRLERNRSFLSQVILWTAVLREPTPLDRSKHLSFSPLCRFELSQPLFDSDLAPADAEAPEDSDDPTTASVLEQRAGVRQREGGPAL